MSIVFGVIDIECMKLSFVLAIDSCMPFKPFTTYLYKINIAIATFLRDEMAKCMEFLLSLSDEFQRAELTSKHIS